MTATSRFLVLTSCALWLAATGTARAGGFIPRDDCAPDTRRARCQYDAELRNAKRFESLDCRGLVGYCESYRHGINRSLAATYYRPVAESAPVTGPLPQLRPLPEREASDSPATPTAAPTTGTGTTPPAKP